MQISGICSRDRDRSVLTDSIRSPAVNAEAAAKSCVKSGSCVTDGINI